MLREALERSLLAKKVLTWEALETFVKLRDSHGVHDMAVEVQALERAIEVVREAMK